MFVSLTGWGLIYTYRFMVENVGLFVFRLGINLSLMLHGREHLDFCLPDCGSISLNNFMGENVCLSDRLGIDLYLSFSLSISLLSLYFSLSFSLSSFMAENVCLFVSQAGDRALSLSKVSWHRMCVCLSHSLGIDLPHIFMAENVCLSPWLGIEFSLQLHCIECSFVCLPGWGSISSPLDHSSGGTLSLRIIDNKSAKNVELK